MANLVTQSVVWKKGERGNQRFIIYDSDGTMARTLTGNTYTFKFWAADSASNKGSGSLTIIDGANGIAEYAIQSTDTDTVDAYRGEIIENSGTSSELHTSTFDVIVLAAAPA